MTTLPPNDDLGDDPNQRALEEIVRAIEWNGGQFALILARCNSAKLRSHLVERLRSLCTIEIREIVLDSSVSTLYTTIQTELNQDHPEVLMLYGLDSVIALDQLLTGANQVREEFRKNFNFPLVWWITDEVLQKLIRLAPDFYSWTTTVEFTSATNELIHLIQQTADQIFNKILDVGAGIFIDNIAFNLEIGSPVRAELESAWKYLQNRGANLDPELESSLEFVLGRAIDSSPEHSKQHFERSLALLQQHTSQQSEISINATSTTGDVVFPGNSSSDLSQNQKLIERQGCLFYCLSLWWYTDAQRHPDRCNQSYSRAKDYVQQGIEIFKRAKRPELVAKFINGLADILKRLQQWDELETVAKEAVNLHQTYPDLLRLARAYGFLAEVALSKSAWTEAKQLAQKAQRILKNAQLDTSIPASLERSANLDWALSYHQGWYLLSLARAQRGLEQLQESIDTLKIAKVNTKPEYDPQLYILILEELRNGYFKQGEYLSAFQIKQEQRSIEQRFGLRAFIGADRLRSRQQVTNPVLALRDSQETIPQEIAASGRKGDVNRLIERIGRNDHKLTVIYGQSGVGKSSILQAGLIPALKQQSIGTRDVLPVLQRVYTNWIQGNGIALTEALKAIKNLNLPLTLDSTDAIVEQLQKNADQNLLSVLIFDQFEEFFFICKEPKQRKIFYNFLQECLKIPYVKCVLSLREDYIHYLLECNRLVNLDAISNNILDKGILYYLGNLSRVDSKSLIETLTEKAQINLERSLIDRLVDDLAAELGEVRPIELQVVGAQLQTELITTLTQYQERGPKEVLVQRYLEEVIQDCGDENKRTAQLVLYLLTDENNTRPLKTRPDLEGALKELTSELTEEIKKLDLVLNIFVLSGLVVLLQELPNHRYQLIHDYLVSFIRQQQGSELIEKLKVAEEQRKRSETKLNRVLKWALAGSLTAGLMLTVLSVVSVRSAWQAQSSEIQAIIASAKTHFTSNQVFDALIQGISAKRKLQKLPWVNADTQTQVSDELERAVYRVVEYNRLSGHNNAVWSVAFSFDGQTIASASGDNTIKLWNRDGSEQKTLQGHSGPVWSVVFSPDGQTIASASEDKTIKLWNRDGSEKNTLGEHSSPVLSVAFSPDGQTIASASQDNTIKLWKIDGTFITTLKGHSRPVWSVAFSPDGKTIASASEDSTIKLWKIDGTFIKTLKGHSRPVWSVAFSPDGKTVASASEDSTIKLWKIDGALLRTFRGHSSSVLSVAFSPNGQTIASAGKDYTIKLWKIDGTLLTTLDGHIDRVRSVAFSADGQTLASASEDRTIKLWKLDNNLLSFLQGHSDVVIGVRFSPNGQLIASASDDKTVKLSKIDGTLLKIFQGHTSGVLGVDFSPDGKTIASASNDSTIKLWKIDGTLVRTLKGHQGPVWGVAFSPDGQTIASASEDMTVKLWKIDGTLLKTLEGHSGQVRGVAFSPDGQTIASASLDKTVKLWKIDGTLLKTLKGHSGVVLGVSFSPDGQTIASASWDNTVKLWNIDGTLLKTLTGHSAGVLGVDFSPDGQIIASASLDQTVKLWKIDGTSLGTLRRHSQGVREVNFSPDGKLIASASDDKTVILWNKDRVLNLDPLTDGCNWVRDYLKTNPTVKESDRHLCDGIAVEK
ncbi:hypothetical protein H1Q63_35155 [Desmonostoc muscorum CCALA 125]|nr:hypothetical protein [Desmonostoc muscorum CCALA 125]